MGWVQVVARLFAERTANGVLIADSSDGDFQVGSSVFTADLVLPWRQRQLASTVNDSSLMEDEPVDHHRSIFRTLHESVSEGGKPVEGEFPLWAARATVLLLGPRRITVPLATSSLERLRSEAGATVSPTAIFTLKGKPEVALNLRDTSPLQFPSDVDIESVLGLQFSVGEMFWHFYFTPLLSESNETALFLSQNPMIPLSIQFVVDESLSDVMIKRELNAIEALRAKLVSTETFGRRASSSVASSTDRDSLINPAEALALIKQFCESNTMLLNPTSGKQLLRSLTSVEQAVVAAPLEWATERQLFEEEISVLDTMCKELQEALEGSIEKARVVQAEAEKDRINAQQQIQSLTSQRLSLERKIREYVEDVEQLRSSNRVEVRTSAATQLQLLQTEERLARLEVQAEELSAVDGIHALERVIVMNDRHHLLQRVLALEGSITAEAERLEKVHIDGQLQIVQHALEAEKQTQFELVMEFQQKELKWQRLLKEAVEENQTLELENKSLREEVAHQIHLLRLAREIGMEAERADQQLLSNALERVKEVSPLRARRPSLVPAASPSSAAPSRSASGASRPASEGLSDDSGIRTIEI